MLLNCQIPSSIYPSFLRAFLTALEKKGSEIKPVAVGCTLHHLTAKVACSMVKEDVSALLAPCQLGFGVRRGIEAAIHAGRNYICYLLPGYAIYAFNLVHRDRMLKAVKDLAPWIY